MAGELKLGAGGFLTRSENPCTSHRTLLREHAMGERSVPPIRKTCKRVAPFAELTTGAAFAGNVPVIFFLESLSAPYVAGSRLGDN